jgi:hypothetical protein
MNEFSDEAMHRLGYHPVISDAQKGIYEYNRRRYMELFDYVNSLGPSREVSLALTALQESLMWTNAAVACNGLES